MDIHKSDIVTVLAVSALSAPALATIWFFAIKLGQAIELLIG